MSAPTSRDGDSQRRESPPAARARPREDPGHSGGERVPAGRAEARRLTSAGLADLAERQAKAVAALDRALEARLGEFDRAFDSRRTHLEGRLSEAEGSLAEAIDAGVAEFKRAASDERRMLHEEAAAQLAELERTAREGLGELEEAAASERASLRELIERVHELEQAAAARIGDLADGADDPGPRPRRGGWVSPGWSGPKTA